LSPPSPASQDRRPRVLLVDDEISSTEVLALILADAGLHVTTAADARLALERLDDARPDLVITDFMMPGMNGGELVRQIHARAAYRDVPVLLISGAPQSALRTYAVDAKAFLRKPFSLEQFLGAVRALLPPDASERDAPAP
jgi:CheY-like chemotaxis protein